MLFPTKMFDFTPPAKLSFASDSSTLALDTKGGHYTFISHAHSDHVVKQANQFITSQATLDLLHVRGDQPNGVQTERVNVDGIGIELLDAGHILGSRQIHVKADGKTFTYTGDTKLSESLTGGKYQIKACDELLIEATFGKPEFVFPDKFEVYEQMSRWTSQCQKAGQNIVLGGYALGKAQEIVAILNKHCSIEPLVTKEIFEACQIYNKHGHNLKCIDSTSDEGKTLLNQEFCAVVPMNKANNKLRLSLEEIYGRKCALATCSGWNLINPGGFCLSDHADFNELIEICRLTEAKKIYCTLGQNEILASALRARGFNAVAIEKKEKKTPADKTNQVKTLANYF